MAKSQYEKYVVRKPIYEAVTGVKNRQSPSMTFMSRQQVPEVNSYIELGWIYGIPRPNPYVHEHVHDYDEIILHWGGRYETPQDLGAEIEFYIGGQPITFNTTTGIFIPRGIPHGPLTWKKFRFPHIEMTVRLGAGEYSEAEGKSGIGERQKELPRKTVKFDFEQYVVRSPIRELAPRIPRGRQSPTMTYLSSSHIPGLKYYLELGWIWDHVERPIPEMVHKDFDEIVLHIGGDPQKPEDLGADLEFHLGGELLKFDTSNVTFIPRGLRHGPLSFYNVRKPFIEMAIMLGCGSVQEGWGHAFENFVPIARP